MTGNAFGEDGIELLRGSLEAKGHLDALGTLSDDEGLEEDDEEEEEEEVGNDDETSHREDVRDDSIAEKMRVVSVLPLPPRDGQDRTDNVEKFSFPPQIIG